MQQTDDDDTFETLRPRYSRPTDDNLPIHAGRLSTAAALRQTRCSSQQDDDLESKPSPRACPRDQAVRRLSDDDVDRMTGMATLLDDVGVHGSARKPPSRRPMRSDQPLLEELEEELEEEEADEEAAAKARRHGSHSAHIPA
jgi:hypothetical protein